jgi:hypothetical protein
LDHPSQLLRAVVLRLVAGRSAALQVVGRSAQP